MDQITDLKMLYCNSGGHKEYPGAIVIKKINEVSFLSFEDEEQRKKMRIMSLLTQN